MFDIDDINLLVKVHKEMYVDISIHNTCNMKPVVKYQGNVYFNIRKYSSRVTNLKLIIPYSLLVLFYLLDDILHFCEAKIIST